MNKTTLHWSYQNFHDVPMDLYLYEQLEEVYLKENFISAIPKWLLNVTTLKFIHLAGNNLNALPEEMYLLENLEFLDVSNNSLTKLPQTVGRMIRLQRLNVSGNQLSELPAAIGSLKRLEELDISKNQLKRLPIQLSECSRLNELNLSDNSEIWHIPERISSMPSLQSLSADRCALIYLPNISKFLNHVRIFHNTAITHVPMVYEKFFQNFYDNRQKTSPIIVQHSNFFWVQELETSSRLLLPIGTRKVFPVPSRENLVTLYDDCLHAYNTARNRLAPLYENGLLEQILPEKFMVDHIKNGAIARCTLINCANPLYTSYYFMVVKRRGSTSRQLFTCNFCTQHCANQWLQEHAKKYYQVEWQICDDE